jgi:hypothetical protein
MSQEVEGDDKSSNQKAVEVGQEGIMTAPQMPMMQMMPMPNYGYPTPQMQQPMQSMPAPMPQHPAGFPAMAPQGAVYYPGPQMGTA